MFISYKICTGSDRAEIIEVIVFRTEISLNKKYEVEIKVIATSESFAMCLDPLVCLPCSDRPFHIRVICVRNLHIFSGVTGSMTHLLASWKFLLKSNGNIMCLTIPIISNFNVVLVLLSKFEH